MSELDATAPAQSRSRTFETRAEYLERVTAKTIELLEGLEPSDCSLAIDYMNSRSAYLFGETK